MKELSEILYHAGRNSTAQCGAGMLQQTELLTKSAAYRSYGRSNVDRWIKEGLLKISRKKIYRNAIEAVAASSNRHTYLLSADRH